MIKYQYQIAGIPLQVEGQSRWMYQDHGVLTPFLLTEEAPPAFTLEWEVVEELPKPKGDLVLQKPDKRVYREAAEQISYIGAVEDSPEGAYMQVCRREGHSHARVLRSKIPGGITPKVVLRAMDAPYLLAKNRGFLLHASHIRYGDEAIVFTAPSGVGKSTHAQLWMDNRGAELINGDRVAIRVETDGIYAYGVPFTGSSKVGKWAKLPLRAIVRLRQAPLDTVQPLQGFQAFRQIWEGCSVNFWNKVTLELTSRAVLDTVSAVPVYELACTPALSAVTALESILEQER